MNANAHVCAGLCRACGKLAYYMPLAPQPLGSTAIIVKFVA